MHCRFWVTMTAVLLFATAAPALAGPFEDGMAAFKRGDWAKAAALLQPLAEAGNPEAQEKLGLLYERGDGVKLDNRKAFEWYMKAALQGDAFAQGHVATFYRIGVLDPPNYTLALDWYRRAAEQNNRLAQVGLGYMYQAGEGVSPDGAAARDWFKKGAEQGDALGQLSLGSLYKIGKDVPRDLAEAYKWFTLASTSNDLENDAEVVAKAKREREDTAERMSKPQMDDGLSRAKAWQAK
jgi:TPR repeat protein